MINHTDPESLDDGTESEIVVYTRDDGESPAHSVVQAVAEATERDPTRLSPLYDVVDTDALDELATGDDERRSTTEALCITFRFEGCDVAVYADGRTIVSQRTAPRP
jgi:hypothetical protein